MATFCEWAAENPPEDPEAAQLATAIGDGLRRIKAKLSTASCSSGRPLPTEPDFARDCRR